MLIVGVVIGFLCYCRKKRQKKTNIGKEDFIQNDGYNLNTFTVND